MYHNVATPPVHAKMKALYVLPCMFRFQMWFLKKAGFRVVTIGEIVSSIERGVNVENLVAITFDDGYQDFYDNALPLLRGYGYPATVFVVSDLVGKSNIWDTSRYGGVIEPLMGVDRLREIQKYGIEIGSHSKSHIDLTTISDEELRQEAVQSKQDIEAMIGNRVDYFCYPFGGCNERVMEVIKETGYRAAIGTKRGTVMPVDSIFEMRRIPVRLNTHPLLFIYKLMTDYEDRKGRDPLEG